MLQLNVSQASTICRASGRAMRSLGIWLRQSAFCKLKKTFLFLGPEKKITLYNASEWHACGSARFASCASRSQNAQL